jgi:hypothetical protein
MKTLDIDKINQSRRSWKPNNPLPLSEYSQASKTISRCLALTKLEPAVASFISNGLDKHDTTNLSQPLIDQLLINIKDEENHELALTQCKMAMIDYDSSFEKEAAQLCKAWSNVSCNPITTAAILENGIFFLILPLYQLVGGTSLKQTSRSISGDEAKHVILHREAAQRMGSKPTKEVNSLRIETITFLAKDIKEEMGGRWSVERMLNNSISLLQKGTSDLEETKVASVNCPFEISNRNIENYA